MVQDRIVQKKWLSDQGFPVGSYGPFAPKTTFSERSLNCRG